MNLCLDCKHSSRMLSTGDLICAIDPDDHDGWMRCDEERHSRHPAACGQMGRFFVLKETE
jgi:hypothetical protein